MHTCLNALRGRTLLTIQYNINVWGFKEEITTFILIIIYKAKKFKPFRDGSQHQPAGPMVVNIYVGLVEI